MTGTNAFIGLLLGVALGSITAFVASRFKALNELIAPMAIAVSAMPIIVLVAIFNDLFAITSEINDGLLAQRFAPSQRAYVASGTLTSVNPGVDASVPRDEDNR